MTDAPSLLLGLIGDNIARSQSPRLHRLSGAQNGIRVRYDSLIPNDMGASFEEVFDGARTGGYRGLNITYPYKEKVVGMVRVDDPLVRAMGSVNTVLFEPEGPVGLNTDYTGFMASYRAIRGHAAPGVVAMIGTGGVGRAVAFGLLGLGAREIRLVDRDPARAEALAEALNRADPDLAVSIWIEAERAAEGATGLINCTPVGMYGHEGAVLTAAAMAGAEWAFDAVYTPADTQFLTGAEQAGLAVISGWELFFFQGVHAWKLFSGKGVDEARLRAQLIGQEDAA
ncbi:shikimate dehydrogenase family protein [Acidimangrovimonas sediminis]|uniref:shikimate dehydrogenase family protein n=1 Tax=Acidimangrovimonas sediminis TaxID=2056283 RepID=UPI000C80B973|nr:shikimate dehydrogenase [Acidimangrovimonas sediminis]